MPTLFLVLGSKTLDFTVLATEETLVVQLTDIELLNECFEFKAQSKNG